VDNREEPISVVACAYSYIVLNQLIVENYRMKRRATQKTVATFAVDDISRASFLSSSLHFPVLIKKSGEDRIPPRSFAFVSPLILSLSTQP
jgi:hypothetical protein